MSNMPSLRNPGFEQDVDTVEGNWSLPDLKMEEDLPVKGILEVLRKEEYTWWWVSKSRNQQVMRNVKKCVVVVICNLIQTGAEAGEEGASSWGALCFTCHDEVPNVQRRETIDGFYPEE